MDSGRRCLLLLILAELIFVVTGNLMFEVHHKYGGRGKGKAALGALKAHDLRRRGRMLAAIDFQMGGDGSPTSSALYYTKITIGTPPVEFQVQVDTGSDILWVNCHNCQGCPTKTDLHIKLKRYDLTASSTGKIITCDQDFCGLAFSNPTENCQAGMICEYAITYGDGSRTEGSFIRDNFIFNQVTGDFQTSAMNGSIAFGCSVGQSGELGSTSEAVDGIVGFGQANTSMLSQLASSGRVKKVFSHCLDGNRGGGIFAIGEVVQPKVNTTPLVPNQPHYNLNLKSVDVGGQFLNLSSNLFDTGSISGTIIDSGTTLAYLPLEVYQQVLDRITGPHPDLQTRVIDNQFTCFAYTGNVDQGFPVVGFHFEDSLVLSVNPSNYLFTVGGNEYCIGWQNSGVQSKDGKEVTLLGDIVLSNKLIMYDLENQTIGWTDYNCSSSIRVRDETTGNIYTVASHNISSGFRLSSMSFIATLIFIVALHKQVAGNFALVS